jgi:hypothetical protein
VFGAELESAPHLLLLFLLHSLLPSWANTQSVVFSMLQGGLAFLFEATVGSETRRSDTDSRSSYTAAGMLPYHEVEGAWLVLPSILVHFYSTQVPVPSS